MPFRSCSSSASQRVLQASLGIRQSPPGRQRRRPYLGAIRQTAALELLHKETAVEVLQPVQKHRIAVPPGKSGTGQMQDLGRAKAESQHMIEVKIVQLIGAYQLFSLLGNLPVLVGGQQFRAYRGVQNIQQHAAEFFALRPGSLIGYQMPHQRFGDPGVYAVHAHVVAVVGGPAQRQLAQIAGADHQAALLVGQIHQFQGAYPGLRVSNVMSSTEGSCPMSAKWLCTVAAMFTS